MIAHHIYCVKVYFTISGGIIMTSLSAQFKKVRTEKGFTQKQTAEALGITEQAYQRYEYGKVVPSALVLIALADYFDVSIDYLVGRSDDPSRH